MKKANRIITILIFIFLYIPMAVLIVASFNTGKDITQFEGFTLQQYVRLFQDRDLLKLLGNSLLISILASGLSTVFGTFAAVGIHGLKPKMRKVVMSLTNIPMTNPDIVTGISLSLLFVFIGSKMLGQKDSLTFWTLLIAHMTFNLPYVILNVMPKLQQMNPALTDAAMDLGCTPLQAFFKVTLPEIMPGVISGAIMAFTMSLDDFVISYFVTGMDFVTLPVKIYSEVKKPIQPKLYAMFTLLFLMILILMIAMNVIQARGDKKKRTPKVLTKARKVVYAAIAFVLCVALVVGMVFLLTPPAGAEEQVTINVYNWGQYIADGSDDSLDIIAAFEKKYPNIKVNYSTYDSNEIMYSKLSSGGITVDVIFPSDYMIARMISENMLLELDYSNIPNYKYIDESFKNTAYDPHNLYSVPYTWGTVGIIYNTKYVDEADVTGWELLWNEKYTDRILMFDNSRDAFSIAQFLTYDDYCETSGNTQLELDDYINTTDKAVLDACAETLKAQKPVLQQYVMDQIYSTMENEEAWIATYYAGDCMTMIENNPDLAFYLPEDQGFNLFIDAACIPTCCQEKDAAETFINFLCDPEISAANMDWVCYSTPISEAKQYLPEETVNNPIAYPSEEVLENGVSFAFLPEDISRYMESLFMQVRNS